MGHSKDAVHWDFGEDKIEFVDEEGQPFMPVYAYDPRLVKIEDTYYIMWCGAARRHKRISIRGGCKIFRYFY